MAKSYVAYYWATPGMLLLGGVKESNSCRYQTREMAEERLRVVRDVNGSHCAGEVMRVRGVPEIFVHCGDVATCIGAVCPGCGKRLTVKDAQAASER